MKKLTLLLTLAILVSTSFAQKKIFNGKNLKGWEIFIGTPIKGFEELKEKATPESTYSVVELGGQKVIRISGDVNASIATKKSFKNYHLRLEYKWGENVYGRRNSGLLYHSFGEFGEALGTWMPNIELQLMHERLGDTYLMNNTYCETTVAKTDDDKFIFAEVGSKKKFGKDFNGQSIKKAVDAEKPLGEWNIVDLYCFGRTAIHVVNGTVVMINENCGVFENGTVKPLIKGKIQIQSEGGEMFIRKIDVKKIKALPKL